MRIRLSLLMALIYAMQGAFWPLLAVHLRDLGVAGFERGWIFATFAIASVAMPLGAGQLVDRFFAAQRLLALIFTVATGFLIAMAAGLATGTWSIFALFMTSGWSGPRVRPGEHGHLKARAAAASGLRKGPALGDGRLDGRGLVRLVGDGLVRERGLGAGCLRGVLGGGGACGHSVGLQPHPAAHSPACQHGRSAGGVAAALASPALGDGRFLLTALGVHMTTPSCTRSCRPYLGLAWPASNWIHGFPDTWPVVPKSPLLPSFPGCSTDRNQGDAAGRTRCLGASFGSLACDPPSVVGIGGIPLQGVGFACFTVAGQVFIDSQAQSRPSGGCAGALFVVTSGIGVLLGSVLAGDVMESFSGDYALVFLVPCVIDLSLLVYFYAGFRPHPTTAGHIGGTNVVDLLRKDAVRGTVARVGNLVTESADG